MFVIFIHFIVFRYVLIYVIFCSLTWLAYDVFYLSEDAAVQQHLFNMYIAYGILLLTSILLYILTFTKFYRDNMTLFSIITVAILCGTSTALFEFEPKGLSSPLSHFTVNIAIILITYTMLPLHLWQNCLLAAMKSILFEIEMIRKFDIPAGINYTIITVRILLHLCVHMIGFQILIMNVVRMRGTFIEVGQNLLVKRQLEMEKQVKMNYNHFAAAFNLVRISLIKPSRFLFFWGVF